MRNYVWELKQLGYTYKSIASALGASSRTISQIGNAKARAGVLYEPIRNLHRNAVANYFRSQGIHGAYASAARRDPLDDIFKINERIADISKQLLDKWDLPYQNYLKDPERFMRQTGRKTPPHHFTQKEIEARVKKGLSKEKELEGKFEPDAEYWRRSKKSPIIQDEKTQGQRRANIARAKASKGLRVIKETFKALRR